MALSSDDKLGPYEILGLIGVGGMGEVYLARDPRLGRNVAIKVSAERFSERFEREARAVAALNHTNICTLHDVGPNYLVMEFVEGASPNGPVPLGEALRIARQITDALEAAHEKGIVHRDLKPGNIKVKPDGTVKILDFGLAQVVPISGGVSDNSPTISMPATEAGVILGTAGYMSPEQARGKPVDKRTDIWAFGVVLYEMLTGRRPFEGETLTDTLAAVALKEPDLHRVPYQVRKLLRRCLEKDPKNRLRDVGDAMALVEDAPEPVNEIQASRGRKPTLAWAMTGVLAAVLAVVGFIHLREQPQRSPELVRFQIQPELFMNAASPFSISPDGRKLVFVAAGPDGVTRLWIRSLDSLELRPLSGTETEPDIPPPFWSPDSRYVAFDAVGKLKRVDVAGGPPQTLCDVSANVVGGSWNRDGTIIFAMNLDRIVQIPASGGTPSPVTALDASRKEAGHVFPSFLPDGRHFIYLNISTVPENSGVYVGSLDAKPSEQSRRKVVGTPFGAAYVPPTDSASGIGHLLFRRERWLMAQPFDDRTQELSGEPVAIAEGLSSYLSNGLFSASSNGVLVRWAGGTPNSQLTWFDKQGRAGGVVGDPGVFNSLALSPDNRQAVFSRLDYHTLSEDLWLLDFSRETTTRFTFGPGLVGYPVWSPDASRVAYAASRDGQFYLYQKFVNGAKDQELLTSLTNFPLPTSWSSDDQLLMYTLTSAKTGSDVWVLPLKSLKPFPLLHSEFNESSGQFSPEMRRIAYVSNDNGREEVYVRTFSPDTPDIASTRKLMVSKGGGTAPKWRPDGKEITYIRPDGKLMVVAITDGPAFDAGTPGELVQLAKGGGAVDVAADGRILQAIPLEKDAQAAFTVLLNWQAVLKK
jgi:serine/threonine protein kinase